MTTARAFYSSLRPASRKSIHEWAEGAIYFGTRQPTARQGPYRASLTPYMRGIFDALRDPMVSEIVVKKSAQIGLTQAALIWLAYIACEDPGPCLFVTATDGIASYTTEKRFIPMIEDSPVLRCEVADIKYPLQKNSQQFKRCAVDWCGANSPSQLSSRPVRYMILDETNKYPVDLKEEGNVVDLAIERTKNFWNRKILMMSTPTTADGFISKRFELGDKRYEMVPCPTCGHKQALKFDRLRFDSTAHPDEAGAGAWYECEQGCRIDHASKVAMMDAGESTPTQRASRAGVASFHTSSMYSPFVSWGELVTKFLTVKDDPSRLQNFINSDLGEDWIEKRVAVGDNQLSAREIDYATGGDPRTVETVKSVVKDSDSVLVCSIDVQKDHYWVLVRRYWFGGHSALLSYGRMFSEADINAHLDTFNESTIWVGIDSGHKAKSHNPDDQDDTAIYDMAMRNGWIPTKGASGKMGMPYTISEINPFDGTRRANEGLTLSLAIYDTHAIKALLAQRQVGEGWGRWWIPKDAPADYRAQVTAEQYNETKGDWEMRPGRRHNHATDCECIADVVARIAGVNRPNVQPAQ